MTFYNLAREYTATTGTSDVVLTGAVPGCNTWDNAGVPDGATVEYSIITYNVNTRRPTGTECGSGTYTTSTKTLARTTVESSTNGGSKISLTGLSEVFVTPLASDANGWGGGGGGGVSVAQYTGNGVPVTIANGANNFALMDTEVVDADGIATVASNTVTVAATGDYFVSLIVFLDGGAGPIGDGFVTVSIFSSGPNAPEVRAGFTTAMGLDYVEVVVSGYLSMSASGTIKAKVWNDSGISLDCSVASLDLLKLS